MEKIKKKKVYLRPPQYVTKKLLNLIKFLVISRKRKRQHYTVSVEEEKRDIETETK